ncbi:MAG: TraB/GumN family protein [Calditrichaeota bacterium]|nr:TraB/GumN family protein [Calditrichota bacterium]
MQKRITLSRITLALLSFLLVLLAGCAGSKPAKVGDSQALLWKITHPEATEPSYLYGTIHLIPQSSFFVGDSLSAVLERIDKLVLEIDMSDPAIQTQLMMIMPMAGGETLQTLLGERYDFTRKVFLDSFGLDLEILNAIKPMLVMAAAMPKLFDEPAEGYEMFLLKQASQREIPVSGLETVQEQGAALDVIPLPEQANYLYEFASDLSGQRQQFRDLVGEYLKGNLQALYVLMASSGEMDAYGEVLLDGRNRNWVPRIREQVLSGGALIAVGAGHFGGDQGLLKLLPEAGFTLTPIQ